MVEIKPYLQKVVERFSIPSVQESLEGFTRTMQFYFTDTKETWLIRAVDGKKATLSKRTIQHPDIAISMSTDTMAGVMNKKINGPMAFMLRKIKAKGAMEDLIKLQVLLM